jgi:hypothetical protein
MMRHYYITTYVDVEYLKKRDQNIRKAKEVGVVCDSIFNTHCISLHDWCPKNNEERTQKQCQNHKERSWSSVDEDGRETKKE